MSYQYGAVPSYRDPFRAPRQPSGAHCKEALWGEVVAMTEQSTSMPTPLWRDPLFIPGDRFPLGPPHWDGCEDEPSGPTTRPFSLRGVVAGPRMDAEVDWPY